jgi:hypothetical protein
MTANAKLLMPPNILRSETVRVNTIPNTVLGCLGSATRHRAKNVTQGAEIYEDPYWLYIVVYTTMVEHN